MILQIIEFFKNHIHGASPTGHPRAERLEIAGNPCKSQDFRFFIGKLIIKHSKTFGLNARRIEIPQIWLYLQLFISLQRQTTEEDRRSNDKKDEKNSIIFVIRAVAGQL